MSKVYREPRTEKGSNIKTRNQYLLLLLIIFLQTALLLFHMHRKVGFHIDELWSYSFANSLDNEIYFSMTDSYPELYNKWMSGRIFNDYLTVQQEEKFAYKKIHNNQIKDMHPPLYSFILHSFCSLTPNTFSKWHGNIINILFFLLSQFLLFYIAKKLFSEKIALFSVLFYGFSAASINTFIFIRMYAMLVFLTLLTTLVYLKALDSQKPTYYMILIIITIAIGSLTQYFYLIYTFHLTIVFDIICIFKKKYTNFLFTSLAALSGVIIAYFLFPELLNDLTAKSTFIEKSNSFNVISVIWQKDFWYFVSTNLIGLPSSSSETISIFLNLFFILCLLLVMLSLTPKNIIINKINPNSPISKIISKTQKSLASIWRNRCDWILFFLPNYLFVVTIVKAIRFTFLKDFSSRYFFVIFPYLSVGIVITLIVLGKIIKFNKIKERNSILPLILLVSCIASQIFNLSFLFPDRDLEFPEFSKISFTESFKNSNCILMTPNPVYIHDLSVLLKECKKIYNISNLNQIEKAIKDLKYEEKNIIVLPLIYENISDLLHLKYKIKCKKILSGKNFLIYYDVFEIESV